MNKDQYGNRPEGVIDYRRLPKTIIPNHKRADFLEWIENSNLRATMKREERNLPYSENSETDKKHYAYEVLGAYPKYRNMQNYSTLLPEMVSDEEWLTDDKYAADRADSGHVPIIAPRAQMAQQFHELRPHELLPPRAQMAQQLREDQLLPPRAQMAPAPCKGSYCTVSGGRRKKTKRRRSKRRSRRR